MYGNKSKNLEQYQKSEGSYNTVKSGNQVIFGILKELERSMNIVASSIEKTKEWKPQEKDLDLKNKHCSDGHCLKPKVSAIYFANFKKYNLLACTSPYIPFFISKHSSDGICLSIPSGFFMKILKFSGKHPSKKAVSTSICP